MIELLSLLISGLGIGMAIVLLALGVSFIIELHQERTRERDERWLRLIHTLERIESNTGVRPKID